MIRISARSQSRGSDVAVTLSGDLSFIDSVYSLFECFCHNLKLSFVR
jgi:hypothetical protein